MMNSKKAILFAFALLVLPVVVVQACGQKGCTHTKGGGKGR